MVGAYGMSARVDGTNCSLGACAPLPELQAPSEGQHQAAADAAGLEPAVDPGGLCRGVGARHP
jgi:hypothetical protein